MGRVEFVGVGKQYGDSGAGAVQDVNLTVEDGEFLVLLGPSGCGKSTLLKMVAGLEDVTSGEIYIDDRLVNYVKPGDRNVAMVFQSYALYPHMTVRENIGFPLKMHKLPKAEIDRRVTEAAEILGLRDLLDRRPEQLSGGQRQRVALGRSIVREPAVFLMDEPLSNLDAQLRVQTREEILKLHARLGTTTIYVTHDQIEAMTMGHRIVVMRSGVVQQVGKPQFVYDHPANTFVAAFLGNPRVNLQTGAIRLEADIARFEQGEVSFALGPALSAFARSAGDGAEVALGVRPEDISVEHAGSRKHEHDALVKLPATITLVEPVGSDLYVRATTGTMEWMARTEARLPVRTGDEVTLMIDLTHAHLFGEDGMNLEGAAG
ncbi:MAG: ABC transporter ATP-binding protein [Thermomicrobiales bacterium]|nr:ABC transporter ATP-binding protein [Thermomicrobiales bacterium]